MAFPHFRQLDMMDCGPTCLRMIAKYYGRNFSLDSLREKSRISRAGVSLLGISKAAESLGFRTLGGRVSFEKLEEGVMLPCVAHWDKNHFVVVHKITKKKVHVADPAKSLMTYSRDEFLNHWASTQQNGVKEGVVLLLEPTTNFYEQSDEVGSTLGIGQLLKYLMQYRSLLVQLLVGMVAGSVLQLLFPFLTKAIVDVGVSNNDIHFIYLVLFGQLFLSVGETAIEFVRGWILLHISARVNISILSDFLVKLLKLPLSFFDTKMTGDILQRINDHKRIEGFLTNTTLSTLFSFIHLLVFGAILAYYNLTIAGVFALGSALYAAWIVLFLNKRKQLDYKRFEVSARNQSNIIQFITGVHEIKLSDCGTQKLWEWEKIQARLFKLNVKSLSLSQNQQVGAFFINQGKNIFIIFLAAKGVVEGHITLGEMLAIQYITGQMNGPVEQLISFLRVAQDAKISIERLNDIHGIEEEEAPSKHLTNHLPDHQDICFDKVSFTYPGAGNEPVLRELSLRIPQGKTTAIVGSSGSGKTTLIKLLLRIYDPDSGQIRIGSNHNLKSISHQFWRSKCGVVMQEGFIFSDTIAKNIAIADEQPDIKRLNEAARVANLYEFIENSPLGYNTKIGAEGNGISQGQRQRILIARAVYKNPDIIFFDEATSALDANNERVIMENLNKFCQGRTVVVVAHRLSTVKHADQIIVLERGRIVEQASHAELVSQRGRYYELIKNQLELGN
ncbi:ATP-binding cassette domain-containing protein [Rudanella paleaurantiibacter]|uniref:ATP-binding cassette domain-containing protein n=1 Tax=Rudanella paleaurantiibacter TaxID=2614655 RepID=A0A7J5TVZ2_9BACT|nr:peptidase domain-containing ABC transporter [Rudanella paleaurantiibacter]KAB7727302.1 ATP-binding cassette domain-containing protein [Rudanella paleaurantiibacter]